MASCLSFPWCLPGTVSFSTAMALLVWVFSRIPTARFWILVFLPRNFWGRPIFGENRWWAQTKFGAETQGVLLLVASGASKNILIDQSLLIVKLFIDSLKKKHPSTCNAVRNRQILCYSHVFNHEAVPAQILNDQHRGKALLLRCLSIRSTNQHHRIL